MTITHVVIDVSDADKERAWEWVLGVRRVWVDHDPYLSAPDHQGEEAKRKIMHQGKIAEVAFAYFTEIPYEHVFTVHEGRGDGKVDFRMILNGIETTVDVKNASRPKGYGLIWPAKKPWEGVADILVYTHLQELGTYRVGGWCYRDEYECRRTSILMRGSSTVISCTTSTTSGR